MLVSGLVYLMEVKLVSITILSKNIKILNISIVGSCSILMMPRMLQLELIVLVVYKSLLLVSTAAPCWLRTMWRNMNKVSVNFWHQSVSPQTPATLVTDIQSVTCSKQTGCIIGLKYLCAIKLLILCLVHYQTCVFVMSNSNLYIRCFHYYVLSYLY